MPEPVLPQRKVTRISNVQDNMISNAVPGRITDPRFIHIQNSTLYKIPSRKQTHVPLDQRFAHMLHDESFTSRAKVDRYGRRLRNDKGKKELERLYMVEEPRPRDSGGSQGEGDIENRLDDVTIREAQSQNKEYDPMRDGGFPESSSGGDTSDEAMDDVDLDDAQFPETVQDDIPEGKISARMAVVNLDWDNIRAIDLMAVFSSFAPEKGRILKVSVYPSEFGRERMEKEETDGPPKEIFSIENKASGLAAEASDESEGEGEDEDEKIKKAMLKENNSEEFDSANLRRYQLERLRYFYAILTCSSPGCAEEIYKAVDGAEYLSTANFFDLRFVPDDMDFSNDIPRDECDQIPNRYRPNDFVTDALQHSKVKLTWDEDDMARKDIQRKAFSSRKSGIDEQDLEAYLGSASSDGDSAGETIRYDHLLTNDSTKPSKTDAERQRMRALLGLNAESAARTPRDKGSAHVGDMQITFSSGLSASRTGSVFQNQPEVEETTVERYVRKEKERKAKRKERIKTDGKGHPKIADNPHQDGQEAKEVEKDEAGDLGFNDPFFTEPTNEMAKATAARKESRMTKRAESVAEEVHSSARRAELELLMLDEKKGAMDVEHFDMAEIVKAEKAMRRKKRKGKISEREKVALAAKKLDHFAMDIEDPRFRAVYERSEFAIDPNHPRYQGTEGMNTLLEGTRHKRARYETNADSIETRRLEKRHRSGIEMV